MKEKTGSFNSEKINSLILSTLKKSSFLKSMLLLNFPIQWYLYILNLFEYYDDDK